MVGLNILWFVVILMGLVLIHEAGHMVVAKRCGMRVERFSIFFGRPLASFRRGETEYAIGWLPLGGYVKISGMTQGEEIPPEVEHRAYHRAATWRRVATIAAGPAVNIALAVVIFAAIFWIGVPTAQVTDTVDQVRPDSAAAQIGMREGDRIVSVDGVRAQGEVDRVRDALRSGEPGDPVTVTVARDGETVTLDGRRQVLRDVSGDVVTDPATGEPVAGLGFTFGIREGPTESYGFISGIDRGLDFTWFILETNVDVIGDAFTSAEARDQVSSVVGIGAMFNEVSGDGLITLLRFVGVISLALGIFNLLPILPLDGGHILFALIEKVKGSSLSRAAYERTSFVGLALLMVVFVVALQNDIGRITGEGFQIDR